jgi:hypothetical protein
VQLAAARAPLQVLPPAVEADAKDLRPARLGVTRLQVGHDLVELPPPRLRVKRALEAGAEVDLLRVEVVAALPDVIALAGANALPPLPAQ